MFSIPFVELTHLEGKGITSPDSNSRLIAIDPRQSFCLCAPAGSGKTEILIQRYLSLLGTTKNPKSVLAITFTRKAASEMKDRVLTALSTAEEFATSENSHKTRELARKALIKTEEMGLNILKDDSLLNIKTIDSFCNELVDQMPVTSSLGGSIEVSESPKFLYKEAVNLLLTSNTWDDKTQIELKSLALHFDNDLEKLEELLIRMLSSREEWQADLVRANVQGLDSLSQNITLQALIESLLHQLICDLKLYAAEINEILDYVGSNLNTNFPRELPKAKIEDLDEWICLANLFLTKNEDWRKRFTRREGFSGEKAIRLLWTKRILNLSENFSQLSGFKECLVELKHFPQFKKTSQSDSLVESLISILPRLVACLLVTFQKHSIVDFTHVTFSAADCLGDDETPTDLSLRLDYQISHILLDEFQDTSINQYRLLLKLTRGWSEHNREDSSNPRTLFIVGDPMQSIYGFRDADVSLFLKVMEEGLGPLKLTTLFLTQNFRSAPDLILWINHAFSSIFSSTNNIQGGKVAFTPATSPKSKDIKKGSSIEIDLHLNDHLGRNEAAMIVAKITKEITNPNIESIGILGKTRRHFAAIMKAMREQGLEYNGTALENISDSQEITDLLSLCKLLARPSDKLAWFSFLRAPWAGLSLSEIHSLSSVKDKAFSEALPDFLSKRAISTFPKDTQKTIYRVLPIIQRAINLQDRRSLSSIVEKAWLDLGGSAGLTQHQADNVEFFFEVLDECWLLRNYMDISWIEERIKGLYVDYGNPEAKVQLMTIHKAKGLEFDCVFLPGLNRQARANEKPVLLIENFLSQTKEGGVLLAGFDKEKERRSIYNYLWHRKKMRSLEEDKRLLYVAATRAKEKLYLSGSVKDLSEEDRVSTDPIARKNSFLSLIWNSSKSNIQEHKQSLKGHSLDDETLKIKKTVGFSSTKNHLEENLDVVLEWPQSESSSPEREIGIVVHQTLEAIVTSGSIPSVNDLKPMFIDRWISWLDALSTPKNAVEKALSLVESNIINLLNDNRWGNWMLDNRHLDSHAELSLTYVDSQARIQDLVIDRTFIEKETGIRWIIDYKTTRKKETETLMDFIARESRRYSQQLKIYRDAIADSEKRPTNCGLYFTSIGHFEHILAAEE